MFCRPKELYYIYYVTWLRLGDASVQGADHAMKICLWYRIGAEEPIHYMSLFH